MYEKTPFIKINLPNGLTLIAQHIPWVHSVSIYLMVGAGSRHETKQTAGVAHFLEHMAFEGTENFPSSRKGAEYIERIGGKSAAWTDKESVMYYVKVSKEHVDTALNYLSEILLKPTLNIQAIEKEKRIIFEELSRKRDNPEVEILDCWFEWIWGKDQSLGRSILGDETSIGKINQKSLKAYMNKLYIPGNMAISVVGNISVEELEKKVTAYFGETRGGQVPRYKKLPYTPKSKYVKIIPTNTLQNQLIVGFVTGVFYNHEDYFTMKIIADLLSNGVSSRLLQTLIYEQGIAYSMGALNWPFSDTGLFYIHGGFSTENVEKAVKLILKELKKLMIEKISTKELNEVKEKAKTELIFSTETPDALAYFYGTQQIIGKKTMSVEEILSKIDAITVEQLQSVAQKYFLQKNLRLLIRGPLDESNAKNFEDLSQIL
ncbi:insulinase family protein [Candidatus Roizmanbacteria bacterium]|nr:insulinase family protein [Candidatus Roizmanbacteria bacterium]